MRSSNLIIAIGLIFDIVGAFFLAKGIMAKKIPDIIKETGTYISRNKAFQDSLLIQKIEALFGMIFLITGFSLQFIANLFLYSKRLSIIICALLIAIPILLGLLSFRIIKYKSSKYILKIEATYHKEQLADYDGRNLDYCGHCLKVSRDENESDENYKKRIKHRIEQILN